MLSCQANCNSDLMAHWQMSVMHVCHLMSTVNVLSKSTCLTGRFTCPGHWAVGYDKPTLFWNEWVYIHVIYDWLTGQAQQHWNHFFQIISNHYYFKSLIYVRCGGNVNSIIFKLNTWNSSLDTHHEIALRWMQQNLTKGMSMLVQEMAWCHQAPSHYLCQFWPWSMSLHGIITPQWANNELDLMEVERKIMELSYHHS